MCHVAAPKGRIGRSNAHLPHRPGPQTLAFVSLQHLGSHSVKMEQLQDGGAWALRRHLGKSCLHAGTLVHNFM